MLELIPYLTNEELMNATIDEIVAIALQYGFATPYTALFVDPSVMADKEPGEGDEGGDEGEPEYTTTTTCTGPAPTTTYIYYTTAATGTATTSKNAYQTTAASPGFALIDVIAVLLVFLPFLYRKRRKQ